MKSRADTSNLEQTAAGVRSIERCIDILDLLVAHDRQMTLTDLAHAVGAPKSTMLTILRTLVGRGLVAYDAKTKLYRIGLGFMRFAEKTQVEVSLRDLALPHLKSLSEDTSETVTLAMTDGLAVFYLCRIMGSQPLQYVIPVGMPRPMHATAGGKILLAHMTLAEREKHYARAGLAGLTERTITDVRVLEAQLDACRHDGYAIACGETSADLFGVAAPIFGASRNAVAAVNLGGPLSRFARGESHYIAAVMKTAEAISSDLYRLGRVDGIREVSSMNRSGLGFRGRRPMRS
jgi:DNA-binding IclR family transcriptional regulator